ncbi:ankyrin repeat [Fusarium mundagurra]|uniref:Ankyrin repeat n=1 Tax=Fusarium mundagurra TaxID=1567541 RepID=A0A8H5Z5L0_9HYPO|nr:ankyrin repeat [Fusarium mundagurra]
MDNLFRAVIDAVTCGQRLREKKNRERALGLIKWLLSSGQDPNIRMRNATPLERAVGAAQPDLTELLLIADADPDRACKWSRHSSLMDLALGCQGTSDNKVRMIKLLLPHTRLADLVKVLHTAIKLRDPDLVEQVVERGPDLLASTVRAEYSFYHDHYTALSVAAAVDIDATTSILRHIEVQYPSRPTSAFITPDVFIAAAGAGNTDVVLFLHGISPIGGSPNLNLITSLQAALRGFKLFYTHLGSPPNWLELLIGRGAVLPGGSVALFAGMWWDKALLAALDAGGSANETNTISQSALHCALRHGRSKGSAKRIATVKILLERGAQLRGGEVLQAMRIQDRDLVLLLLHHRAKLLDTHENRGPTLDAEIMLNDDKLLERVVAELPGYYDAVSLCEAVHTRNTRIINLLLANRRQQVDADLLEGTAVGLAAKSGDIQLVRKLLEHLGKPDSALLPSREWDSDNSLDFWRDEPEELIEGSPLALAVSDVDTEGDSEGFFELLENGYWPDKLTLSRLAMARRYSCLERILHFRQRLKGVPPHPPETPCFLWQCIEDENEDMLHCLLKAGADANEHNRTHVDRRYNRSPLQMAVEGGNLDIIDLLLQAGAHINAPPSFFGGATALQIAAIQEIEDLWYAYVSSEGGVDAGR